MVFYGVVGPALELSGEVSPLVAHVLVEEEEEPLLVQTPLFLVYVRVEVVVPSFPALLADASWIVGGVPGMFSEMTVHFWAPYLLTSFLRYSSSSRVHAFLRPG